MKRLVYFSVFLAALIMGYFLFTRLNVNPRFKPGDSVDEYHGVQVYYNGGINHSSGRNLATDGYNLGLRYQCVEFVKRYYYERFRHKMPDTYGHAKSFFDNSLSNGSLNTRRLLLQYKNGGTIPPQSEDILVFSPWLFSPYGHVAIVTKVENDHIEIIQQNPGPFGASRESLEIQVRNGCCFVENKRVLGWLRLQH